MPPSDGPSAVEWIATIARRPTDSSEKYDTCSCPRKASSTVTNRAYAPRDDRPDGGVARRTRGDVAVGVARRDVPAVVLDARRVAAPRRRRVPRADPFARPLPRGTHDRYPATAPVGEPPQRLVVPRRRQAGDDPA